MRLLFPTTVPSLALPAVWRRIAVMLVLAGLATAGHGAPPSGVLPPEASAGALARLPARGLAAAIAESGRIEVPSVDPSERITLEATQAARWTEGVYDVWHLTGGVRIVQGQTEAKAHEAVVWIEQAAFDESAAEPRVRSMVVRMAGSVQVRSRGSDEEETAARVRGEQWAGRFWYLRDHILDFTSVVPEAGTPPRYETEKAG